MRLFYSDVDTSTGVVASTDIDQEFGLTPDETVYKLGVAVGENITIVGKSKL